MDEVLEFEGTAYAEMIAHADAGYPLEACGLLVGEGNRVDRFEPCTNEAASARVYTIPGREMLRAERQAEGDGLAVIGVFHSHTHSQAYPSPTDVAQAPDPGWHYVIVSLRDTEPDTRSFRIVGEVITTVAVSVA